MQEREHGLDAQVDVDLLGQPELVEQGVVPSDQMQLVLDETLGIVAAFTGATDEQLSEEFRWWVRL